MTLRLLAIALLAGISAQAELIINPGDIQNGHYTYELERADMQTLSPEEGKVPHWTWEPTGNKFFDDVYSFSNLSMTGGHWGYVSMKPGAQNAEFVYKFDFTSTGFHPTSMRLREPVRFEMDGATWQQRATTGFTSAYRIGDTGEWVPIHTVQPDKAYRAEKEYQSNVIDLPRDTAVVYYKVVLTSDQPILGRYMQEGEPDANPFRGGPLWNFTRTNSPDAHFQIAFTAAPSK